MGFRSASGRVLAVLLTTASALAAPTEPSSELHRGIEYRGASAFFDLPAITVVYPAGTGEPVALNRRSAEARARWLASVYKTKTVVVADDQITAEQKAGNVLVLGWNNRAFGTSPARPFTHGPEGTRFFGIVEPNPRVDVLVYHRNPLNWSNYVLFWTRIDPERDRFQVIPRVGSDWAMYRDYLIVRQGMFVPARVWPPARDIAAEADHTAELTQRPGGTATFDSPHYHLTFDRALFKDEQVKAIVKVREAAFAKAVAAIGTPSPGFRISLYLYEKDEDKLIGSTVGDPAHEVPASRELHLISRVASNPSAREELKLLARDLYGPCYLTALYEGLALSFDATGSTQDMELQAAMLRADGKLPDLATMLDEERFRSLVSESGPVGAGILMTWLRQTYGPAGLKKAYGLPEGTPAALAVALGTTESAVKASYTGWADGRVAARKREIDFLDAEAEAQKRRLSSDWKGMAAALQKALAAKPGDLQTLFNLASAQMRADDLSGAEASLKSILSASLSPEEARFRIFGHYQLGRVFDLAGRRGEALKEYDAVLALPDDHGAHALARERKAKPATREQLE